MNWINDDLEESKRQQQSAAELAARSSEIASRAETIYNNVWEELVVRLKDAKAKGVPSAQDIITNGDPFERLIKRRPPGHDIIVPQLVKSGQKGSDPECVTISLTEDRLKILVSGLRNEPIYLLLDLGEDEVVLPKYEGERLTIQDTVKLILRPLLFPDLFAA
jgi:hypothetical protein